MYHHNGWNAISWLKLWHPPSSLDAVCICVSLIRSIHRYYHRYNTSFASSWSHDCFISYHDFYKNWLKQIRIIGTLAKAAIFLISFSSSFKTCSWWDVLHILSTLPETEHLWKICKYLEARQLFFVRQGTINKILRKELLTNHSQSKAIFMGWQQELWSLSALIFILKSQP